MTQITDEKAFEQWLARQITAIKQGRYQEVDWEHLLEELEDWGRSEKNALESNLAVLLGHLLKLLVQHDAPESIKNSWYSSVNEHRLRVKKALSKTPSLKHYLSDVLAEAYLDGRKLAIKDGVKASHGIRQTA